MNQEYISMLARQWEDFCNRYSTNDLDFISKFIHQHTVDLVDVFYANMIQEKEACKFLNNELIQNRLKSSLNQWMKETFDAPLKKNFEEIVQKQLNIGKVHARIGIPSWLIIRGIRQIEDKIYPLLTEEKEGNYFFVLNHVMNIMSFSAELMCKSYEHSVDENNNTKHSYRLFSAMQDISVQKDKQRSSLLDWENELMFKVFSNGVNITHPILSKSEFGLWFIHKAAYVFTGSDQVNIIIDTIHEVDQLNQQILQSANQQQAINLIQIIRDKNREITILMNQLFQLAEYIDSGNDPLTQLLNRRYLNTILTREITLAKSGNTPLAMLALDVDYFKNINDQYGHAVGDSVLKHISSIILKYTRASDYAFRIGGEEFLLLQIDCDEKAAHNIANQIRHEVENSNIASPNGIPIYFTISIGVTLYDGHPDYQRFIDAADMALYSAKQNGRNNVVLSD